MSDPNANGLVVNGTFVPEVALQQHCLHNPDDSVCAHVASFYMYRIYLFPNIVFFGIFALSLLAFLVVLGVTRRAVAFNLALMLGVLCEIFGYAGRILSWKNQWSETGFLVQVCCLTIGPAFMAAGLYLCLRRIVSAFGPENSRIPPEYYTRIFIPADVISLFFQALGACMASIATHNHKSSRPGSNVMLAGLSLQVITLVAFIAASVDFGLRARRRHKTMGSAAFDQNPSLVHMRRSTRFKLFLYALGLSTICILWRSAFRVAELSQGWTGRVNSDQGMFIGFEGVLVVIAVLALNFFHPGIFAKQLFMVGGGLKGCWCCRRKGKKSNKASSSWTELESKTPTRDGFSAPYPPGIYNNDPDYALDRYAVLHSQGHHHGRDQGGYEHAYRQGS